MMLKLSFYITYNLVTLRQLDGVNSSSMEQNSLYIQYGAGLYGSENTVHVRTLVHRADNNIFLLFSFKIQIKVSEKSYDLF